MAELKSGDDFDKLCSLPKNHPKYWIEYAQYMRSKRCKLLKTSSNHSIHERESSEGKTTNEPASEKEISKPKDKGRSDRNLPDIIVPEIPYAKAADIHEKLDKMQFLRKMRNRRREEEKLIADRSSNNEDADSSMFNETNSFSLGIKGQSDKILFLRKYRELRGRRRKAIDKNALRQEFDSDDENSDTSSYESKSLNPASPSRNLVRSEKSVLDTKLQCDLFDSVKFLKSVRAQKNVQNTDEGKISENSSTDSDGRCGDEKASDNRTDFEKRMSKHMDTIYPHDSTTVFHFSKTRPSENDSESNEESETTESNEETENETDEHQESGRYYVSEESPVLEQLSEDDSIEDSITTDKLREFSSNTQDKVVINPETKMQQQSSFGNPDIRQNFDSDTNRQEMVTADRNESKNTKRRRNDDDDSDTKTSKKSVHFVENPFSSAEKNKPSFAFSSSKKDEELAPNPFSSTPMKSVSPNRTKINNPDTVNTPQFTLFEKSKSLESTGEANKNKNEFIYSTPIPFKTPEKRTEEPELEVAGSKSSVFGSFAQNNSANEVADTTKSKNISGNTMFNFGSSSSFSGNTQTYSTAEARISDMDNSAPTFVFGQLSHLTGNKYPTKQSNANDIESPEPPCSKSQSEATSIYGQHSKSITDAGLAKEESRNHEESKLKSIEAKKSEIPVSIFGKVNSGSIDSGNLFNVSKVPTQNESAQDSVGSPNTMFMKSSRPLKRIHDRDSSLEKQSPLVTGQSTLTINNPVVNSTASTEIFGKGGSNTKLSGSLFGTLTTPVSSSESLFTNPSSAFSNSEVMFGKLSTPIGTSDPIIGKSSTSFDNSESIISKPSIISSSSASRFGNPSTALSSSESAFGKPITTASSSAPQFGKPSTTVSSSESIFGKPSITASSSDSIFGKPSTSVTSSDSIFGMPSTSATSTESIFGKSSISATSSDSIFGKPSNSVPCTESIFGKPITTATSLRPIFGMPSTTATSSESVFGKSETSFSSSESIFGKSDTVSTNSMSIFGKPNVTAASSESIFGKPSSGLTTPSSFSSDLSESKEKVQKSSDSNLFKSSLILSKQAFGSVDPATKLAESNSSFEVKTSTSLETPKVKTPIFGNITTISSGEHTFRATSDPNEQKSTLDTTDSFKFQGNTFGSAGISSPQGFSFSAPAKPKDQSIGFGSKPLFGEPQTKKPMFGQLTDGAVKQPSAFGGNFFSEEHGSSSIGTREFHSGSSSFGNQNSSFVFGASGGKETKSLFSATNSQPIKETNSSSSSTFGSFGAAPVTAFGFSSSNANPFETATNQGTQSTPFQFSQSVPSQPSFGVQPTQQSEQKWGIGNVNQSVPTFGNVDETQSSAKRPFGVGPSASPFGGGGFGSSSGGFGNSGGGFGNSGVTSFGAFAAQVQPSSPFGQPSAGFQPNPSGFQPPSGTSFGMESGTANSFSLGRDQRNQQQQQQQRRGGRRIVRGKRK